MPLGRAARWLILLAAWSVPGLVTSTQVYFLHQRYEPISFAEALLWQMPGWYFWVPATPLILLLVEAFPLGRGRWQRSVPVHLSAIMALSVAHLAVSISAGRYLVAYAYYVDTGFGELMTSLFLRNVHLDVITYASVVAAGHAYSYYRQLRARELETAELEARLARAELAALKDQLRPHFLFNTLNAISVLVRMKDTERAVRTLTRLGELLRATLDNAGTHLVPLEQELAFLSGYLEIQQIRFGDRLEVEVVACDGCLELEVPNLLFQPLVENSVRHGLAPRSEPGRVEVEAVRAGDRLRLEVRDNGVGLPAGWDASACKGIGVANVRERLAQLYPGDHELVIENRPHGGVRVWVDIPARERDHEETTR